MTKELIKALLNYDTYEKYKLKINKDNLGDRNIRALYDTIETSHEKNKTDLSVDELKALHLAYNPTLTTSAKINLEPVFEDLRSLDISPTVAEDLVQAHHKLNVYTEIAALAIEGGDNREIDVNQIQKLVDSLKSMGTAQEDELFVTTDIDELLKESDKQYQWKIHLGIFNEVLTGIGGGVFGIIAARPNAAKTAFCISLTFQPGGFLDQGAKVHWIGNEEKAARTMLRGISSYTGMTKAEIIENPKKAGEIFQKIKHNIFMKDAVGMTFNELEEYVAGAGADILIIDQLDKIRMNGAFASDVDRIRALYTYTRELAKKYDIAIIGVCQASFEAEGRLSFGFECLENSRTGKAAEVDLCITIGKEKFDGEDTGYRRANFVKNKLTGIEEHRNFMLNRNLSRITA